MKETTIKWCIFGKVYKVPKNQHCMLSVSQYLKTLVLPLTLAVSGLSCAMVQPNAYRTKNIEEALSRDFDVEVAQNLSGEKTIYLLPDFHSTSFHRSHVQKIKYLGEKFGIKLVGLESNEGLVTKGTLEEEFAAYRRHDPEGLSHPYVVDEEKTLGVKHPIQSLDDFLKVDPLWSLVLMPEYRLVGLDNKSTYDRVSALEKVLETYEEIRDTTLESMADQEKKFTKFLTRTRLKRLRSNLASLVTKLPDLKLPTYDESFSVDKSINDSDFYCAVADELFRVGIDVRSTECVELAEKWMNHFQTQEMVIVYGRGHKQQILDECERRGISSVVIGE